MAHRPKTRAIPSQKQVVKQVKPEIVILNPETSVKNSVDFIKKLTAISVSRIALARNMFPNKSFALKIFNGEEVQLLRSVKEIPQTQALIDWLNFAFTFAMDQYLQKIILVIQSGGDSIEAVHTLETYVFSYDYNEDEICYHILSKGIDEESETKTEKVQLSEDISATVRQLVRSIDEMTARLTPLPDSCEYSLRLELREDTPADLFCDSEMFKELDAMDIVMPTVTKWKLGKVKTKFTTLTASIKSSFLEVIEVE